MEELTIIQKITAYAIPIIFAITVHEAAHGYAARYFGDMTAHYLGRISLKPIKTYRPSGNNNTSSVNSYVGRYSVWMGKACSSKFF